MAWKANREIDLAEWTAAGRRLGAIGRCGQWGIGDWLLYGNAKFGERYVRAARITGYDVQTLMNMVYVASRFEISRRREDLSWSHHETLASLDPDMQDRWLETAVCNKLSVADLRAELRAQRSGAGLDRSASAGQASSPTTIACPHCGETVPLPRRLAQRAAA